VLIEDELTSGRLVTLFENQPLSLKAYYWVVPENRGASEGLRAFTNWIIAQAHS